MMLTAVVGIAAVLRFARLTIPASVVFDETYYARDACLYAGNAQSFCGSSYPTETSWVHPPLGKWIIAMGIKIFGFNAFGWRCMAALTGTALVAVVFLLARKLFADRWVAGVAGTLVATDFMLIVQSRVAMLDIFLAFFVAVGFLFLAMDRERITLIREHLRMPFPGDPLRRMLEWRLLAGGAFGCAIAVKWQGIWALVAALLLAATWSAGLDRARIQAREPDGPEKRRNGETGVTLFALVLVPLLVYGLSYSRWFADNYPHRCTPNQTQKVFLLGADVACRSGLVGTALAFSDLHSKMLDFHANLEAKHPYASQARSWPFVIRPVAYYYEGKPKSSHVMAFGNPATWWASILALVWLLIRSLGSWRAERFVLAAWAMQYLPWLLPNVARPAIFIFYMTPMVPFMMIGLAAALGALRSLGKPARWAVWLYLAAGVGLLLWFFYPVIAAVGIPYEWWRNRMWFPRWI